MKTRFRVVLLIRMHSINYLYNVEETTHSLFRAMESSWSLIKRPGELTKMQL